MIRQNILTALNDGYDVILEGILSTKSYKKDVDEILSHFPAEVHAFYFDVSLAEATRRHRSRPSRNTISYTEDDLQTFYPPVYEPIYKDEKVIPETYSAHEAVTYILKTSEI